MAEKYITQMKTYKEALNKKSRKVALISNALFLSVAVFIFYSDSVEYVLLFIPILLGAHFFGELQCPSCKCGLHIPFSFSHRDKVNHCCQCGFDLNQEFPKEWARLDGSASKELDE